ncbi:MAG: SRPBCC family protein [Pseudoruegeria sp.]
MRLSTREDIEAPIDAVFTALTDFGYFERIALRRGIEVERTQEDGPDGPVPHWVLGFKFRGKKREMATDLVAMERPNSLQMQGIMGGMTGDLDVELVALSRGRTRLTIKTDIKATGLTSRLLLQSMKLAKTKLQKRYRKRVKYFAGEIEKRISAGRVS